MPTLTLGDWTLHTVEAGTLWLDGGAMFGAVPRPLWSRTNPPDERNRIELAMRCLLLVGHGRRVLVDVGLGGKSDAKFRDIFRVGSEPRLEDSLAALGVDPGDVTDVVLTHLHFDHAGGATARSGDRLVPRLPRARWYVQQRNWDNAHAPNPRERSSYLAENFDPLREAGVLETWNGAVRPWPGVSMVTTEGHTRGHQVVRIEGGGEVAYFVADLVPTASHVRVPYVMGYDMAAIETMTEKQELLGRACDEDAWIVLEHDPGVALARPKREGADFAWAERVPAATGGRSLQSGA
ncbi:MAG TPA: MBL fold metallo-hydrolase [Candidatus Acidoferrales bacterium]|nr:MBL fold metallo-hydrolase [Candidatus Acidoferrales bacterium]